jgi:hypothetical protein
MQQARLDPIGGLQYRSGAPERGHVVMFDMPPFSDLGDFFNYTQVWQGALATLSSTDLFSFDSFGHPDLHYRLSCDANTLRFLI